jgi:hypothetical protein
MMSAMYSASQTRSAALYARVAGHVGSCVRRSRGPLQCLLPFPQSLASPTNSPLRMQGSRFTPAYHVEPSELIGILLHPSKTR